MTEKRFADHTVKVWRAYQALKKASKDAIGTSNGKLLKKYLAAERKFVGAWVGLHNELFRNT